MPKDFSVLQSQVHDWSDPYNETDATNDCHALTGNRVAPYSITKQYSTTIVCTSRTMSLSSHFAVSVEPQVPCTTRHSSSPQSSIVHSSETRCQVISQHTSGNKVPPSVTELDSFVTKTSASLPSRSWLSNCHTTYHSSYSIS